MRILLTGGCGFIGCHLASKLLGAGNETVILDNLENSKKENLPPNAEFIKGDIRDPSDIARAMKGCEAIFHLAAVANIRGEDRAGYEVNFLGAKKIFEQAKRIGIKVIFSSSAAVYGNIAACREDSECKPVSQYGISKLKAENFLRKEMPDAFIARLFNVYGSGGKSAINIFARNIPSYRSIKIFGNGMQTRDFVHIDDTIDALLLGIEKSGTYNVGSGRESSLLEVIDIMHSITKAKPEYKFELPNDKEIRRSKADITKIKKLGWLPKIELEKGIKLTLEAEGWKPLPIS